jgi:acetoin:2,6-dichlorophenolindophenol oxidoreductase subunit alpha
MNTSSGALPRRPKGDNAVTSQEISKQEVPKEDLIEFYRRMVRIRHTELKINQLFLKGLVPGTIHLSHGQEAVAVGATAPLRNRDAIVTTHRPHGHALAKGMEPKVLIAEILGRVGGCCQGKGGSMHIADVAKGIMPSLPIVGAGIPIAAGIAFGFLRSQTDHVAVSFLGDAATNIGAFHEGVNLAAIWKLPVVYVIENNLYGVSTSIKNMALVDKLSDRSKAYGIPGVTVDGNDVEAVYAAASAAVDRARQKQGPSLVECLTYRHGGHSRSDAGAYRSKEEVQEWLRRDPISKARALLVERGHLTPEACQQIEDEVKALIEEAAEAAIASPHPDPEEALTHVLA